MKIIKAEIKHCSDVLNITHTTIKSIYPHYYPEGAVNFFLDHHNENNILTDIKSGYVYMLIDKQKIIGTVTLKENELNRLFVLPEFQGMGFGRMLLEFSEDTIFKEHTEIIISASLPAKKLYLKRNYIETGYNMIATQNGDFLCYDKMTKYKKEK